MRSTRQLLRSLGRLDDDLDSALLSTTASSCSHDHLTATDTEFGDMGWRELLASFHTCALLASDRRLSGLFRLLRVVAEVDAMTCDEDDTHLLDVLQLVRGFGELGLFVSEEDSGGAEHAVFTRLRDGMEFRASRL